MIGRCDKSEHWLIFFIGFLIGALAVSIIAAIFEMNIVYVGEDVADEVCKELSGNSAAVYFDDGGDVFDCVIKEEVIVLDDGLIVIHDERGMGIKWRKE